MRILWLCHFVPYPPVGGALQRTYHLLRRAAARHEVHLLALTNPTVHPDRESLDTAIAHLRGFCASVRAFDKPSDASRLHRSWLILSTFGSRDLYDVRWLRCPRASDFIRSQSPTVDLVHADTIGLVPYAALLPSVPYALTHHNIESDMMRLRSEMESNVAKRIYFRREARKLQREERSCAAAAAINITVSDLDGARLRRIAGGVAVATVENGVDVEFFQPSAAPAGSSAQSGAARLVFVASMNAYANRDAALYFLADVWPMVRATRPQRTWTVVGPAPPDALRRAAERDPQLLVTGLVDDVRPFLERASVYVCPISNGGGTRLKVLDALAMEKPLVATTFSVQGLDLVPGTHFLPADTPEEFATQIGRLEQDPELAHRLATAGRDLVEKRYSWDVIASRLEHAYASALTSRD